jgi:hypothetical protein
MADFKELATRPAIEKTEGEQPGRFRAMIAAIVAGAGFAVAFYKWLRRDDD